MRFEGLPGLAVWIGLCFAAAAQLVQGRQPAGATVEGVVKRADTGAPVAGARVMLYSASAAPDSGRDPREFSLDRFADAPAAGPLALPSPDTVTAWTLTTADGRFKMNDIGPGAYRMVANADGYVAREYGQKVSRVAGTPLTLLEGGTVSNVALTLVGAGSIEGHISEAGSGLVVGILVHLMRDSYDKDGRRETMLVAQAMTDDKGRYRFFWIPPGRYHLASGGPPLFLDSSAIENRAFRFYPDSLDRPGAEAIDIQPGTARAIDWNLPPLQRFRFRGRLIDSVNGTPPRDPYLLFVVKRTPPRETDPRESRSIRYDRATGQIEVDDLNPGIYEVSVSSPGDAGGSSAIIRITNADVENVVLDFAEADPDNHAPVRGRIVAAGNIRPPSLADLKVALDSPAVHPLRVDVERDGTFSVDMRGDRSLDVIYVVKGEEYTVSVHGLPRGWYVQGARLDDRDVLNAPAPLHGDRELVITLSPNVGQLEGVVLDAMGKPVAGVEAVLVPHAARLRADLYQKAVTDQSGRFNLPSVAPGDYTVYAWEALEPHAYFDPDFVRRFQTKGVAVGVRENSRQEVSVTLIPANESE